MNLLLLQPSEASESGTFVVNGLRARHILQVLGKREGDTLRVGVLNGKCGIGKVLSVREDSLLIGELNLSTQPPPPAPIQLVLALPRPKAVGRLLQSVTEIGVKKIVLLNSTKVEKYYWSAHQLRQENLLNHMVMGLEMCKDTILPELRVERLFRPFIEDTLKGWLGNSSGYVAHPSGEALIPSRAFTKSQNCIAIGPEGGWSDFEVEMFRQAQFKVVHFGERILSCETAVPTILSQFL